MNHTVSHIAIFLELIDKIVDNNYYTCRCHPPWKDALHYILRVGPGFMQGCFQLGAPAGFCSFGKKRGGGGGGGGLEIKSTPTAGKQYINCMVDWTGGLDW